MINDSVVSVVNGLKSHPLVLAIVVINVLFIGAAAYTLSSLAQAGARRDELIRDLATQCEIRPALKSDRR